MKGYIAEENSTKYNYAEGKSHPTETRNDDTK